MAKVALHPTIIVSKHLTPYDILTTLMPLEGGEASADSWEDGEFLSVGRVGEREAKFTLDDGPERKLSWRILGSDGVGSVLVKDVFAIIKAGSISRVIDERSNTLEVTYDLLIIEHSKSKDGGDLSRPIFRSIRVCNLPTAFQKRLPYGAREHLEVPHFLKADQDLHVIVSTGAGTGLAQSFFQAVLKPLLECIRRPAISYTVHNTQSAETVTELTKSTFLPRAQQGVKQTIILLSGDGGIVDIINVILAVPLNLEPSVPKTIADAEEGFHSLLGSSEVHYAKPTIGLLPFGTGNALASSLGISKDSKYGLNNILRGSPRPLPLFKVTFSPGAEYVIDEGRGAESLIPAADGSNAEGIVYGAVVCSWGFHASLVADSDTAAYRKHGAERFQMAAKDALYPSDCSEPHRYRAKVSIINNSITGVGEVVEALERQEHMYILATLVSNLEKSLTISPSTKPLDGQLRLVHFGPLPAEEVMRIMGLAYQGGLHVKEEAVGYEDVAGVRIDFEHGETDDEWRRVCVDGKIVRVAAGGWMEVRREPRDVLDIVYAS
ncbi:MAG: hypothetical protein M1836_001986 [Candelina mexicana]|nr:MAG: hypothetical protein M1836_001986 [Candelina mexicana]